MANELDLTWQEPIPEEGIATANVLMATGKLHRYGETGAKPSEVSLLESEFAREIGAKYCVAMNSCGSTMFVALKASGVQPGDKVLTNCFTLAPVPGAIAHVGATPVLVDIDDDLTINFDDLERKAFESDARTLLLSHMRGHICDMAALTSVCEKLGISVIEDCAHTMGANWGGRPTGSWGRAGCFSLQSYKHANAGEGGLLVTSEPDLAARAVLMSGSYMLFGSHLARPDESVFERWKYVTPNFSLRMSNLAAAVSRPQLGAILVDRAKRWNERYFWLSEDLSNSRHIRLPERLPAEGFVASSIQFSIVNIPHSKIEKFVDLCGQQGLHIKWFGADAPIGFTSVWKHWQYFGEPQKLPNAERILAGLCDLRLPLSLTRENTRKISTIVHSAISQANAS